MPGLWASRQGASTPRLTSSEQLGLPELPDGRRIGDESVEAFDFIGVLALGSTIVSVLIELENEARAGDLYYVYFDNPGWVSFVVMEDYADRLYAAPPAENGACPCADAPKQLLDGGTESGNYD